MADPNWIKKAIVLSLVFAVPAAVLLATAWRRRAHDERVSKTNLSCWAGGLVLVTYVCWFVNVTIEGSVVVMVAWPLLGMLLSIAGSALAFWAEKGMRPRLVAANVLLLILSMASVIAPN